MRLRHKKNAEELILNEKYCINNFFDVNINNINSDKINENKYFDINKKIFNNNNELYLELGVGKGRFIIENAIKNPNINFIGIEKSATILLKTIDNLKNKINELMNISNKLNLNVNHSVLPTQYGDNRFINKEEITNQETLFTNNFYDKNKDISNNSDFAMQSRKNQGRYHTGNLYNRLISGSNNNKGTDIKNLRFLCTDIIYLDKYFNNNYISKIYLNFSDPWPKDRHYKRRLTYREFLNKYYNLLKDNGIIEFKTDQKDLFDFTLEEIKETKFKLIAHTYDLHNDNNLNKNNIMTEYEQKFSKLGNKICKLILRK